MSGADSLTRESRLRGAIYGLLIGDALGVPYEFSASDELPELDLIEMRPPAGFRRAHSSVPEGTWSDDGAQALHLLKTLLEGDHDIETRLARGLMAWYSAGELTPDGRVFDIGAQTQRALERINAGAPANQGPSEVSSNGNGSLMRVLPAALVPLQGVGGDSEYVARARRQSLPTHGHARSLLACSMSTLIGVRLLAGASFIQALDEAQDVMESTTAPVERDELRVLLDGRMDTPRGTGYVVDSFWTAVAAVLRTTSFESCVRTAIAFGNDTDTTACIAGGWAGLLYGEDGIPERWRDQLRGKQLVEPLLKRLCQGFSEPTPPPAHESGLIARLLKRLGPMG